MEILNRCAKYRRTGYYFKVKPEFLLKPQSLDFLLKYMKSHPVPKKDVFRKKLLGLIKSKARAAADMEKMGRMLGGMRELKKDPELGLAAIAKLAETLGMRAIPQLGREVRMPAEAYYRSRTLQCLVLKALMSVMPRKRAFKYFEAFLNARHAALRPKKMKNVREKLTLHEAVKAGPLENGAAFVQAMTDDGRAVMKVTRCRPADILCREFKDKAIVHAVVCQPDFGMAKILNPAFVLTREKSLVLGMPYCGHVWHDKRVHKTFKHPARKFWEELN